MHRQPNGRKLVRTTVQIEPALLEQLDLGARDQGLSRSAAIAQILRKALAKEARA